MQVKKLTSFNADNSTSVPLTEEIINNDSIMMRKTLAAIGLAYGVIRTVTTTPYKTGKGEDKEAITITNADCVALLKELGVI